MAGESRLKRKWWHASLFINKREDNSILSSITSINDLDPNSNANPTKVFAYPDNVLDNNSVSVPVASFSETKSPGYFLFRPNLADLESSIVEIKTYQEAINFNNRRIFEFKRTAAWDSTDTSCNGQVPNTIDSLVYETISNSEISNVFKYPTIASYAKLGCCEIELSNTSSNLPNKGVIGRPTRSWYLTSSEINGQTIYSLYSYDFALLSNALVFRGKIDTTILPSVRIFDITWIPNDNILVAICNDGIRRIQIGNNSVDAVLGEKFNINNNNIIESLNYLFPIRQQDFNSFLCKIEFNIYQNCIYVFAPLYTPSGVPNTFNIIPNLYKIEYSNQTGLKLISKVTINEDFSQGYSIGGFSFESNGQSYCIYKNNLSTISDSGSITPINTDQLLSAISTLSIATNPDINVTDKILYCSSSAGQLFYINRELGSPIALNVSLGSRPVGETTSINGEDIRVSPFPFGVGNSHWLFMIDVSASMAGSRMSLIKNSIIRFMQTYVRYNDKISIITFNDQNPNRITKELKTYADSDEVISFINSFLIPSGNQTNFCSVFSNLSQSFSDLKNIFVISDGTFDDCGESSGWDNTLKSSIDSILLSNPGVYFTTVSVSSTSPAALIYIKQQSNGTFVDWR